MSQSITELPPITVLDKHKGMALSSFETLLEAHTGVYAELTEEWSVNVDSKDSLVPVESFVKTDMEKPFNSLTTWYYYLLEAERQWYLAIMDRKVTSLNDTVDKIYEVNLAIRHLVDVLKRTEGLLARHTDEISEYVLGVVKKGCMQLILDMGLRYGKNMEEIEYYDVTTIFTGVLNCRAPEPSPFYKTIAYWEHRLKELLEEREIVPELAELRKNILSEADRRRREGPNEKLDIEEYSKLIGHLENAVFLMEIRASFIEKTPEKLLDNHYCREWVQGIRRDFIGEENPDETARIFNNLLDTAEIFTRLLGKEEVGKEIAYGLVSEARSLLNAIKRIQDRQLEEGVSGDTEQRGDDRKTDDFVKSFNRRFISIDDFDSVFPGTRDATLRYIKKGNIRVAEISREVKFLYREDVEDFIQNNTNVMD